MLLIWIAKIVQEIPHVKGFVTYKGQTYFTDTQSGARKISPASLINPTHQFLAATAGVVTCLTVAPRETGMLRHQWPLMKIK
jgi:hypothetical protein